jgi:hypothetical protein
VRRPGVERKDAPHLTADQAQGLLEAIRGDRLETLFRLMLTSGLRRGEALAVSLPRLSQRVWLQVVSAFIPGLILVVEASLVLSPDGLARLGSLESTGLAWTF